MTVFIWPGKMGSGNGACDCDYRHKRPHEWAEHDHGCGSIFSEGIGATTFSRERNRRLSNYDLRRRIRVWRSVVHRPFESRPRD